MTVYHVSQYGDDPEKTRVQPKWNFSLMQSFGKGSGQGSVTLRAYGILPGHLLHRWQAHKLQVSFQLPEYDFLYLSAEYS